MQIDSRPNIFHKKRIRHVFLKSFYQTFPNKKYGNVFPHLKIYFIDLFSFLVISSGHTYSKRYFGRKGRRFCRSGQLFFFTFPVDRPERPGRKGRTERPGTYGSHRTTPFTTLHGLKLFETIWICLQVNPLLTLFLFYNTRIKSLIKCNGGRNWKIDFKVNSTIRFVLSSRVEWYI